MTLDGDACYRAMTARDARFDGTFFVGVSTTGVYCRPICPARTPRRDRCSFHRSAAEAERAGFRACFRCRPELAPRSAPLDAVPALVARAVARIDAGALNDRSVDDLAAELGVSGRHLRRAMEAELGVSPVELAQTARLAMAKQLLHDTSLGLADVAFASGFASVRRFNALVRERFGRAPSLLRRDRGRLGDPQLDRGRLAPDRDDGGGAAARGAGPAHGAVTLRLGYRPPLDWQALVAFLAERAMPGIEEVDGATYRRAVSIASAGSGSKPDQGVVVVEHQPARTTLVARVPASLAPALMPLRARLRALFDLDAQPERIAEALRRDPTLRRSIRARPGLRVPGAFEPFETAVRAILGQEISVRAATTLAGRMAARFGEPLREPAGGLERVFPTAAALAAASDDAIASLGIRAARAAAIRALARAVASGAVVLERPASADVVERLLALPGIGPWTAEVVAMRALGWPDAFPAGDLGVRRALDGATAKGARERAEPWRPWRAYGAMHLLVGSDPGGRR